MYVYVFVSFGLERPKAQKATYNMVHTGYPGDLNGLEGDSFLPFTKCLYC